MINLFCAGGYSDYKDIEIRKVETQNRVALVLERMFKLYIGLYSCKEGIKRIALFWPEKKLCYFRHYPNAGYSASYNSINSFDGDVTKVLLPVERTVNLTEGPQIERELEKLLSKDELSESTIVDIDEKNVVNIPKFSSPSELEIKLDLSIP